MTKIRISILKLFCFSIPMQSGWRIFLLCLLQIYNCNISFAQQWEYTYGGTRGVKMLETYDNGFAILGTTLSSSNERGLLIKTDIDGNVLWNKTLGSNGYITYTTAMEAIYDGGFIISGYTSQYDSMGAAFVLKLDECGEKQWCKIYGLPNDYDWASDVYQLTDGNYIVLASYFGPSSQNTERVGLMKLDALGNIIWLNDYSHYFAPSAFSLLLDNNNEFLITGLSYIPNPDDTAGPNWVRTVIIKVDSLGNEEWNVPYGVTDHFVSRGGGRETPDGGYLTLCSHRDSALNPLKNYSYLFKTDSNGNVQWGNYIAIGDSSKGTWDLDMIALNDSESVTLSSITDTINTGIYRLKILKIDTAGSILDSVTYGYSSSAIGGRISKTSDGKIIICSTKDIGANNLDIYAIKLNENLQLDTLYNISLNYDSLCSTGITSGTITLDTMSVVGVEEVAKGKGEFLVYPNPAADELVVRSLEFGDKKMEVEIYDVLGQEVFQSSIQHPSADGSTINISALPPGIYFVKVRDEKGNVSAQRFVKM